MRVLFCNITWMDYYKGIVPGVDEPHVGGSYVKETKDAHEKYNFEPVEIIKDEVLPAGEYCLGFVETKTTKGNSRNQLHIENINGCQALGKEESVDDVLVIYCAKHPLS
jgi:hypothetical protein